MYTKKLEEGRQGRESEKGDRFETNKDTNCNRTKTKPKPVLKSGTYGPDMKCLKLRNVKLPLCTKTEEQTKTEGEETQAQR